MLLSPVVIYCNMFVHVRICLCVQGADGSEHTRNPSFDNNTNPNNNAPYTSSSSSNPSPPAIPPLPESILTRNRSTPERSGSTVAKIISQFQEAVKTNHVIYNIYFIILLFIVHLDLDVLFGACL